LSDGETLLLGFIAGGTIFHGLPMGRVRHRGLSDRAGLSALATGILLFLLLDVFARALDPIEDRLEAHRWSSFAGFTVLGLAGFAVGYLSLVYYGEWMKRRGGRRASSLVEPGAAAVEEFESRGLSEGKLLALLIAVGVGVHNFGEGLAIGQAAANELTGLAVTLVVGFALHNATDAFGIVGPMAGERPTWSYLGLLGLIGGGPTFVGTLIGHAWTSLGLSVLFFALAAGSILYVTQELFALNRRYLVRPPLVAWLVFAGVVLGFGTDFIIDAAGV
jgi:ZIP family zinc transporter